MDMGLKALYVLLESGGRGMLRERQGGEGGGGVREGRRLGEGSGGGKGGDDQKGETSWLLLSYPFCLPQSPTKMISPPLLPFHLPSATCWASAFRDSWM